MPEVAQATLSVTPVLEGAQASLTEQLEAAATPAGEAAGTAAGTSFGKGMSAAGTAMTKSVSGPIAAIGALAVKSWKEVDTGLDTIVAKTGASGEELEGMQEILTSLTSNIPTDFATAGAAIGEVNTRFKLTGEELEDLSGQFVKFARLNNQDVSRSVDSVSKMMAAFGVETKDAGSMLDMLNVVGQKTGEDVGSLADLLTNNAAQLKEMGLGAEEAASFMADMSLAGTNSSTAMMGLKTAMKNATEDGVSLDDALKGFQETMNSNATDIEKQAAAYELFGTRAGGAIADAVSEGRLNLEDLSSSLGDFSDSVNTSFANVAGGPMDEFTTTMNDLKTAGAGLVEAAGPSISQFLGTVTDGITKLTEKWNELSPQTQDLIIKIGAIAAVAGPLLIIGGAVISGIGKIAGGIGGLAGHIGGLGGAVSSAAGPIESAAGSFGTFAGQALKMIAAAAALYITAQAIQVLVNAAIDLTNAGGAAIAVFFGMAVAIGALMAVASLVGPGLTAGAVGIIAFGAAFLMISAGVAVAAAGISLVIGAVTELTECVLSHSEEINSIVTTVGESVNGTITAISDGITQVIDAISGGVSGVLDSLAGVFDSIGESALKAGEGFEMLAGAVMDLVNNTGALDLATTLGATAAGVGDITRAAGEAGKASSDVQRLTSEFRNLQTGVTSAAQSMTQFGTSSTTALNAVGNAFRSLNLAAAMSTAINGAISVASAGISRLRSMFASTHFSFSQHIAVPHFSMAGSFNAQTGSVPTIYTSWYAKAAEYGALFTKPTIIGVGDAAQPELLIGEEKLKQMLGQGVTVNNYMTINGADDPEAWGAEFARSLKQYVRVAI